MHRGIVNKVCVDIVYEGVGEPVTSRKIDPIELFRRGNHDYVRAYCHLEREDRYFRLDRISDARITEQAHMDLTERSFNGAEESLYPVSSTQEPISPRPSIYDHIKTLLPYLLVLLAIYFFIRMS